MPMLAERKKKVKWTLNTDRQALWESDSSKGVKFGKELMEKMGWKEGQGLGIKKQGIKVPLETVTKNDNKGLGFKGSADEWIQQQEDFNELLNKLSSAVDVETDSREDKIRPRKSLEKKSKHSKSRVHYKKFTRGKDLTTYSEKDLECILGRRKRNVVGQIKERTNEDSHPQTVLTVNSDSVADYFLKKMKNKANIDSMDCRENCESTDRGLEERIKMEVDDKSDSCMTNFVENNDETKRVTEGTEESNDRNHSNKKIRLRDNSSKIESVIDAYENNDKESLLKEETVKDYNLKNSVFESKNSMKKKKKKRKTETDGEIINDLKTLKTKEKKKKKLETADTESGPGRTRDEDGAANFRVLSESAKTVKESRRSDKIQTSNIVHHEQVAEVEKKTGREKNKLKKQNENGENKECFENNSGHNFKRASVLKSEECERSECSHESKSKIKHYDRVAEAEGPKKACDDYILYKEELIKTKEQVKIEPNINANKLLSLIQSTNLDKFIGSNLGSVKGYGLVRSAYFR